MTAYFVNKPNNKKLLVIEDAKIFWTNFRGIATDKNAEGHRHFCVTLPEDIAEELIEEGWNVKWTKPKKEGYEPEPYIDVNISWAIKPPYTAFIRGDEDIEFGEDLIGDLDTSEIVYIEMAINPSYKSGKPKGYVDSLRVELYEDPVRGRRRR